MSRAVVWEAYDHMIMIMIAGYRRKKNSVNLRETRQAMRDESILYKAVYLVKLSHSRPSASPCALVP